MKVLLCDDHPLFLEGLAAALSSAPDVVVVGQVTTAERVVDVARETEPDVVVMDLHLPGMTGIEATGHLAGTPVLVVSMAEDDQAILSALRAGARGYLAKGASREEVLRAVRTVAEGGAVFSGPVAARIVACLDGRRTAAARPLPQLTDREREVLDLVARGLDNRRISRQLVLSEKTVRNHISHIFAKLQVCDRAQAVAHARDAGLGQG